jgi:dihydrofolate synthase / folylpolyglutamate synthase
MPHTRYLNAINYLFERLPMFSRIGAAAYKKDLTNTLQLCRHFDNPHQKFKTIHVAGTNGKGSVSHMLAAVLQQAGYKTGLYTSPHLKDFRERIRINGDMVPEDFVVRFTEAVKPLIDEIEPSFFEITVAMAFEYFAKQEVDIAVIEVGLGGRLDSTNVITPELSVITNISYDHMNLLGNSLMQIATEKAGIIKPGVPVVVGEIHPETKAVFEQVAAEKKAPLTFAENVLQLAAHELTLDTLAITVADQHGQTRHYASDLNGVYQERNIITLLTVVQQLKDQGFVIEESALAAALMQVKKLNGLRGRWEVVHHNPFIILDVAHNEAGLGMIVRHLEVCASQFNNLHIILGMVKDKDVNKALSALPATAAYYFTNAQVPRALDAVTLRRKAKAFGLSGSAYTNVHDALRAALKKAEPNDLVLVCGSVFLVGEVDPEKLEA